MLAEPVVGAFVDSPDQHWAENDSDTDDSDDDSENDRFLPLEPMLLIDSFVLECRVTLLSDDTRASRNLNGDPRGPPALAHRDCAAV